MPEHYDLHDLAIPVARLRDMLNKLEGDLYVEASDVGNLRVSNADGVYVGYIELRPCGEYFSLEDENPT